jgi:hypothetical protein
MKKRIVLMLLIFALCLGLAACGGKGEEKENNSKVIKVYSLGDYFDPALIDEFEKETGIKVILDNFDTNEEMYPVISKGTVRYDVICASDYMIERLIKKKLLAKLDYANLPNFENIDQRYMQIASKFDKNNEYAVPHTWGVLGVMYNTKKVREGEIKSWNDLLKKKYDQQIVMPDSVRDNFAIALKARGYSINTKKESELKEATKFLQDQGPLVYKYSNDAARDLAIGGSTDIAIVWNGEVLYSREENSDLDFVVPKEGSEEFLDMLAIPANAEHKKNAEKWIDFMMRKDTALKNYEYLTYTIPNKAVIEKVSKDTESKKYIFPDETIISKCESLTDLGTKYDDMYNKYWKKFKSN